ncbi:MAG: hypothetical protein ACOY58_01695, partial [Candidatus Micrarchaeota archaeon]
MLATTIDKMVKLLSKSRTMSFRDLAKELSTDEEKIEKFALCMEKSGLAYLHYPINMIENPSMTYIPSKEPPKPKPHEGNVLKAYDITKKGHVSGHVDVIDSPEERRPLYLISLPEASAATRAYLESVKLEASKKSQVWVSEKNPDERERLYQSRKKMVQEIITRDLAPGADLLNQLSSIVLNEMYGLG